MSSTSVTIQATSAINLTSIPSNVITVNLPAGKYAVTLANDSMKYNSGSQVYIQQVILFNTAPLETANYEKWFYTVNTSEGTVISVAQNQPVYVFIVDQITSDDNSGSANVNFTPI